MSELTKELCKELRDRGNVEDIADELADVEITLAQIKMIYDIVKGGCGVKASGGIRTREDAIKFLNIGA